MQDDRTSIMVLVADALDIAPRAAKALDDCGVSFDARQNRLTYRFAAKLQSGEIFTARDLEDLGILLAPWLKQIEQGWVTEVIPDMHCASGRWTNRRLTDAAATLQQSIAPLVTLHRLLTRLQNLRRADRLAGQFLMNATP